MKDDTESAPRPSEVAMWHKLSGLPDNVTDEGVVVGVDAGRRLQAEKQSLRAEIEALSAAHIADEVRNRARLAASYLVAGDVETARRYVTAARELRSTLESKHVIARAIAREQISGIWSGICFGAAAGLANRLS